MPTSRSMHVPDRAARDRTVRQVLWGVLFANVAVALTKAWLGQRSGSVSLVADAIHAGFDGASNIVGLVAMRFAGAPADDEHPYGHRKFETIAALAISGLILLAAYEVAQAAWGRLGDPSATVSISAGTVLGLLVTIAVNVGITTVERSFGRRLGSELLMADAGHTLADTFGALAVLASFGALAMGLRWADPVAALVVVGLMLHTARGILRGSLDVLADSVVLAPDAVLSTARAVAGVVDAHKVRSRGAADHVHVDLHVHVDPRASIAEAHEITHAVADAIRAAFPSVVDVVIHTEPATGRTQATSTKR